MGMWHSFHKSVPPIGLFLEETVVSEEGKGVNSELVAWEGQCILLECILGMGWGKTGEWWCLVGEATQPKTHAPNHWKDLKNASANYITPSVVCHVFYCWFVKFHQNVTINFDNCSCLLCSDWQPYKVTKAQENATKIDDRKSLAVMFFQWFQLCCGNWATCHLAIISFLLRR